MFGEMGPEFDDALSAILKEEILEDSVKRILLELAVDFICIKELVAAIRTCYNFADDDAMPVSLSSESKNYYLQRCPDTSMSPPFQFLLL